MSEEWRLDTEKRTDMKKVI